MFFQANFHSKIVSGSNQKTRFEPKTMLPWCQQRCFVSVEMKWLVKLIGGNMLGLWVVGNKRMGKTESPPEKSHEANAGKRNTNSLKKICKRKKQITVIIL